MPFDCGLLAGVVSGTRPMSRAQARVSRAVSQLLPSTSSGQDCRSATRPARASGLRTRSGVLRWQPSGSGRPRQRCRRWSLHAPSLPGRSGRARRRPAPSRRCRRRSSTRRSTSGCWAGRPRLDHRGAALPSAHRGAGEQPVPLKDAVDPLWIGRSLLRFRRCGASLKSRRRGCAPGRLGLPTEQRMDAAIAVRGQLGDKRADVGNQLGVRQRRPSSPLWRWPVAQRGEVLPADAEGVGDRSHRPSPDNEVDCEHHRLAPRRWLPTGRQSRADAPGNRRTIELQTTTRQTLHKPFWTVGIRLTPRAWRRAGGVKSSFPSNRDTCPGAGSARSRSRRTSGRTASTRRPNAGRSTCRGPPPETCRSFTSLPRARSRVPRGRERPGLGDSGTSAYRLGGARRRSRWPGTGCLSSER